MLSIFYSEQTQLTDAGFELMDDGFGLTDFLPADWKMTSFNHGFQTTNNQF
ncbi:hypothetical protein [Flagellimonas sp.]|uniref:hypothetical protein n=1 Tax=Flagellimonas sp. TaxID=2058762 RepID=UPI003B528D5B